MGVQRPAGAPVTDRATLELIDAVMSTPQHMRHASRRQAHAQHVEQLLKRGADPNARSVDDAAEPLLTHSVRHGDHGSVRALLRAGARVDDRGVDGATALLVVASLGEEQVANSMTVSWADMVLLLVHTGRADLGCRDRWGRTALVHAARRGDARLVELLLELGAVGSQAEMPQLSLALAEATAGGHAAAAQRLFVVVGPCPAGCYDAMRARAVARAELVRLRRQREAALRRERSKPWLTPLPAPAAPTREAQRSALEEGLITQRQFDTLAPALLADIVQAKRGVVPPRPEHGLRPVNRRAVSTQPSPRSGTGSARPRQLTTPPPRMPTVWGRS
jgi:hypothetical protein